MREWNYFLRPGADAVNAAEGFDIDTPHGYTTWENSSSIKTPSGRIKPMILLAWGVITSQFPGEFSSMPSQESMAWVRPFRADTHLFHLIPTFLVLVKFEVIFRPSKDTREKQKERDQSNTERERERERGLIIFCHYDSRPACAISMRARTSHSQNANSEFMNFVNQA